MKKEVPLKTFEDIRKEANRFSIGDQVVIPKKLSFLGKQITGEILDITDYFLLINCHGKRACIKHCFGFVDAMDIRIVKQQKRGGR
ncbi:MAG: hypothetical protein Q4E53_05530 [Eubacteriales bacterium]|nr:hypothetical protein [Eubacteriales bacterium]